MGDKEFTKEELETLGESTEEEGQETQEEQTGEEQTSETEQSTESAEAEKEQAEEQENMVPQSRFNQVFREKEEEKRKNDLLRRDPEAYRKLYPDEFEEEEDAEQKVTPIQDFVIQDGPYKGKSLSELYKEDPIAANTIHFNLLEEQKAEKQQRDNLAKQSEEELNNFSDTMAQEMFDKKLDDLGDKEGKQIDDVINRVLDWMTETGRGGGNIADAYKLMNFDKILSNAAEKGVKSLIDTSSKGQVRTVNSGKGGSEKSGYGKFMDFTETQLASHIENLSDAEAEKFMREAPKELKEKHPKAFAAWD